MIKLVWDEGPERPDGLDEYVCRDLQRNLNDIEHPSKLITHHVLLTKDWEGPSVHVYGRPGDDAYHCRYCLKTEWVTH